MAEVAKKIRRFIFTYDWDIIEIQGATFKIAWGAWLLMPFQTFRSISGYASIATENIWGWGLLIYGIIHFLAIKSENRKLRRALTFGGFLFWVFTVILIAYQSRTAALLPFFMVIAFFMALNWIRLGIEINFDIRHENTGRPDGQPERRGNE